MTMGVQTEFRKKVLVTGATGLVGSSVIVALVKANKNHDFICLTRQGAGQSASARVDRALREECEFQGRAGLSDEVLRHVSAIDGEISALDVEALANDRLLVGIDKVFHCAADVNLGKDPKGNVLRTNLEGTRNIVALAKRIKARELHYVSTAYAAGNTQGEIMEERLSLDREFNNAYERSKCRAEDLVRASGIPFSIYRPGIIVGRTSDGRIRRPLAFYRVLEFLLKLKARTAARRGCLPDQMLEMKLNCPVPASKNIYFTPIDYVQESISCLLQKDASGTTYHVTGDSPVTAHQIIDSTCEVLKISGMTVGLDSNHGTAEDRTFAKCVGDLFPYMGTDMRFDQTNIRRDWKAGCELKYGSHDLKKMVRAYLQDDFRHIPWVNSLLGT